MVEKSARIIGMRPHSGKGDGPAEKPLITIALK